MTTKADHIRATLNQIVLDAIKAQQALGDSRWEDLGDLLDDIEQGHRWAEKLTIELVYDK